MPLSLLGSLFQPQVKPKVFVSYHHGKDQPWYDKFNTVFGSGYDIIIDKSLERSIDSEDTNYIRQEIRDNNIKGSSVTIVLCGVETWKRRWVDWEISMTLNKEHALLGIILPAHTKNNEGKIVVPDRLHANIATGYAYWINWTENPSELTTAISVAKDRAKLTRLIDNSLPKMNRSLP
ncbi:hypothetical protein EPN96_11130 [bacterium]|nr:MAG: hypothetical protein EPN96_11130 [bacterium]